MTINNRYFLILDIDKDFKISECLTHRTDDRIGYSFGYTYVMPWDLYKRGDIVWTDRQIHKLKNNYIRKNHGKQINNLFKEIQKVRILPVNSH